MSALESHVQTLTTEVEAAKGSRSKLAYNWSSAAERAAPRLSAPVIATRDAYGSVARPAVVVPPAYSAKVVELAKV